MARVNTQLTNDDGKPIIQSIVIKKTLKKLQVATSRKLSMVTGIERGNITRALFDFERKGIVVVGYRGRCPITGKTVNHYKLKND